MIQEYDIAKYAWDFSLTPEIVLLMHFNSGTSKTGLLVAFNYKWTTNKIELYENTLSKLLMLNPKVGLVINVDQVKSV